METSRAINILLRTAHVAAAGILLGGHAFDVAPDRLLWSLGLTIGTGAALAAVEAGPRLLWLHQVRGLLTLGKLILMGTVPFAWDYRLPILLAVVLLASVGSHMPARFRYYSVVLREVIPCGSGPGARQLRTARTTTSASTRQSRQLDERNSPEEGPGPEDLRNRGRRPANRQEGPSGPVRGGDGG